MDRSLPALECDLVMKGGVTSGVVYPAAVLELQRHFRFKAIGGASAGAIAAALTAAAEHGRQRAARGEKLPEGAGFEGLTELSEKLRAPGYVMRRFQPTRRTRPLFRLFQELSPGKKRLAGRGVAVARLVFRVAPAAFGRGCFAGLAAGLAIALGLSGAWGAGWDVVAVVRLGLLGLILGLVGWIAGGLVRLGLVARRLGSTRFGICPGSAGTAGLAPDDDDLPLTDWLHVWINRLAGYDRSADPVTCRTLADTEVEFRSITSDLSLAHPLVLPLQRGSKSFFCREKEVLELFPPPVARFLVEWGKRPANRPTRLVFEKGEEDEYLRFPMGDDLPLVVATRMSLSFPVLLSAVPLYSFRSEAYATGTPVNLATQVEQHWLSDGGIASNFPIHIFDSWIPARPVFGITLYDSPVAKVLDQQEQKDHANEVVLPEPKDFDRARPPRTEIRGVADFLRAVFQTAQSHRDVSQSGLPSYRERIVQVFLRSNEGGLNLDMPEDVLEAIAAKGARAGQLLVDRYVDGDGLGRGYREHLWVRLLVLVAELERELGRIREGPGAGWRAELAQGFRALLSEQASDEAAWYRRHQGPAWCTRAERRIEALLELIASWEKDSEGNCFDGDPPRPRGLLRITPET